MSLKDMERTESHTMERSWTDRLSNLKDPEDPEYCNNIIFTKKRYVFLLSVRIGLITSN